MKWPSIFFLFHLFLSCVDPYEPKTITFEDILVVEAILTDEYKHQEVILSRSYEFEREAPYPETDASVQITNDSGKVYEFTEMDPGRYISVVPFKAEKGYEYSLSIKSSTGKTYGSTAEQLHQPVKMDSLYAKRINDDFENNGMAISIDNSDPTGRSRYFRYEYEETYKIIAPYWLSYDYKIVNAGSVHEMDIVFTSNGFESVILAPKEEEELICYGTNASTRIIVETTEGLDKSELTNFQVHFIESDDYILSHRYSILVRQFVTSFNAYNYYKILRDIASSESLFSENQPGFIVGNISVVNNPNEKVIGFFDVSSVSERRLFFNYKDYYPKERLPPYASPCHPQKSITLMEQVRLDFVHYIEPNPLDNPPLNAIPRECGDCTALGSNVKPSFWKD
ncbi:DUF4249 domain-containing protein [Flagellimonas hymeniacidonis]|uniref:DUF4249 domain-containing protein n=1 Tax=Flagellimonas hymeniacidonis TaxID=2603628 RepID=A0A5C8V176_9FLAO|nr:DUF4249 domain-containing protein [Flagellimonas hymeniacidonis]